ncbi:MAG: tetratricopeptide repeat protein [Isosphaeraceae bacterium]|nr:tetratricopeptide repeat protein [Isosphaeraceae bacterium]
MPPDALQGPNDTTRVVQGAPRGRRYGSFLAVSTVVVGVLGLTAWNVTRSSELEVAREEFVKGRHTKALQHALDHLERRPWSREAALTAARCLSLLDYPDDAEPYYRRAGRLAVADIHVRARAWIRSEHPERAVPLYRELLARDPSDVTALRRLAGAQLALGQLEDMIVTANRLIDIPGGAVVGYSLRGLANHESTNRAAAASDFERVLALDPALHDMPLPRRVFWFDLAEDLVSIGRAVDARTYLDRAAADAPDAHLLTMLGRAYQFEGNLDEAERRFQQAAEADANYDVPLLHLGQVALQRNRLNDAERYLQRALVSGPRRYETLYNLALVYRRLGRSSEAEYWRLKAERERSRSGPVAAPKEPLPTYAL